MSWVKIAYLLLKFLVIEAPALIAKFKELQADRTYKTNSAKVDAAILLYKKAVQIGDIDSELTALRRLQR